MFMFFEFFTWWYGRGWIGIWRYIWKSILSVEKQFSLFILLNTLFAPWKRIVSIPGRSIDERFKALIDNLFSRTIGFIVRLFTLVVAVILIIVVGMICLILAIAWPFVPLVVIYLFYKGITG
jgi:hypothetical protein